MRTSFLLLDIPLPWGKDLADDPSLAPVVAAIDRAASRGVRWRLQGVVTAEGAAACRVVAYHLPEGGFVMYDRHEVVVAPADLVDAAVSMVESPKLLAPASASGEDLLLCTHGRRDVCCGSQGTTLWKNLDGRPGLLPSTTRVCRTSHTGGHRFAPTAIHLPTGTSWAWLDEPAVETIVRRNAPFAVVADRYRGSCALATQDEQVVEHAVLGEVGWPWLEARRTASTEADGDRRRVQIAYTSSDGGAAGVWRAVVATVGRSPVPDCGGALDAAPKRAELMAVVQGTLEHHTSR